MRGLAQLPDSYFDKFKNKKVRVKPFDQETRILADVYIKKLKKLLGKDVEVVLRGSTLFGIAGKGEVEYGVYTDDSKWQQTYNLLKNKYGDAQNIEKNYARFNDFYNEIEVEIIVMKGWDAKVDKKLTEYLLGHPKLLIEYEKIKFQNCESKKKYMIAKDKFFRKVIEMI